MPLPTCEFRCSYTQSCGQVSVSHFLDQATQNDDTDHGIWKVLDHCQKVYVFVAPLHDDFVEYVGRLWLHSYLINSRINVEL